MTLHQQSGVSQGSQLHHQTPTEMEVQPSQSRSALELRDLLLVQTGQEAACRPTLAAARSAGGHHLRVDGVAMPHTGLDRVSAFDLAR
jgi:hypothetical protein